MKKDNIIVINQKEIHGIKNPKVVFNISVKVKDFEFIVVSDNKEIEFECNTLDNHSHIVISADIPTTSKKISLFVINKKKKQYVCSINNNLCFRIWFRILGTIRLILSKIKVFFIVLYKGMKFMWREYHFLVPLSMWGKYFHDFKDRLKGNVSKFYNPLYKDEYNKWLLKNKKEIKYKKFKYNPKISILIPVYNINRKFLSECLDSILLQSYENYEICLVDDCSTFNETKDTLKEYAKKDQRIKVKYRKKNGHISTATNDALKMATGEFIGLVDDDDLLDKDALYKVVEVLNLDKKIDFIYSDEDKLDLNGKFCDPHFKPDFSPDTLLSLNYICHFTVIRKKLVEKVGGFEVGLEGAQDYDLFLKTTEKTSKIYHIPEILYHWRMVEGSTSMTIDSKSYALDKGKTAIENALKRRKIKGNVEKDEESTYYKVMYDLKKKPLVSIIIPTRDYVDILKKCIDSIYSKTTYKNFEIIIANNSSEKKETYEYFEKCKKDHSNLKVIDVNIEFNYSKINNIAVDSADGEYIVLLNNDTEVITGDWLDIMIGYASQKHVGCVGAKLLYEDNTVQHAGVILGLGGVASHAYIGSSCDDVGIYGRLRVPYNYAANTAACLAVKKSKYLEVGGLEEDLKVAYNDIDFNIKLLEKGYYNVFIPQVLLTHYESKSRGLDTTSEKYKRFLIEAKYMYKKWNDIIENDPFYNKNYSKKGWFMLDKNNKEK